MQKPDIVTIKKHKDIERKFEISFDTDFAEHNNFYSVYGFVIYKDKILFISKNNINWSVPGGRIERNETPIQALVREIYEESAVKINTQSIVPFFWFNIYEKNNNNWQLLAKQAMFICKAKEIQIFVKDPDEEIKYTKWIEKKELEKYFILSDVETNQKIIQKLLKRIEQSLA